MKKLNSATKLRNAFTNAVRGVTAIGALITFTIVMGSTTYVAVQNSELFHSLMPLVKQTVPTKQMIVEQELAKGASFEEALATAEREAPHTVIEFNLVEDPTHTDVVTLP